MSVSYRICLNSSYANDQVDPLVDAAVGVVKSCLTHQIGFTTIDINDRKGREMRGKVLKILSANHLVNIKFEYDDVDGKRITMTSKYQKCIFMFINDFREFLKIHDGINEAYFGLKSNFIIVLMNGKVDQIGQMFQMMWKKYFINVAILFAESKAVQVQTFLPFNEMHCEDTTPKIINQFVDGKFIKPNSSFFTDKTKNLFKCPVPVAFSKTVIANFSGRDINLMETLSEKLNFSAVYHVLTTVGYIFDNGTAVGGFNQLLKDEVKIVYGNAFLKISRLNFFDIMVPYSSEDVFFVVPHGAKLTPIEKLFHTFQKRLWIVLVVLYAIGTTFICLSKFFDEKQRIFVFGESNDNPHLNMFKILMGSPQSRTPKRNFARFLVMSFSLFSLVIRTAYVGSFFNLLHTDISHGEIRSIDDILERNFTFILTEQMYQFTLNVDYDVELGRKMLARRYVSQTYNEIMSLMNKTVEDPKSNIAILKFKSQLDHENYINKISHNKNDRKFFYKTCKERYMQASVVMYTQKGFFLTESINYWMNRLMDSGLIEYWHYKNIVTSLLRSTPTREPEKISLKEFEGIFEIWACGLLVCCFVFVLELTWSRKLRKYFSR